jgi:hypothetical protein
MTANGIIVELHSAFFIAIKRSVAIGRNWPIQGVQNLAGFESEPVAVLKLEPVAVFYRNTQIFSD